MKTVILYSQPDCPPCEIVKRFFQEYNIPFSEKNIKENALYREELINKHNSFSTPTILIDSTVVIGPEFEHLKQLLDIES